MPTHQRTSDVAVLASILLSEYRPGTALRGLFVEDGEPGVYGDETFTIDVRARGDDLAGLIATLDAVQLAFNAATLAYLFDTTFAMTDLPFSYGDENAIEILREFAFTEFGILEIVALSNGSFAAKAKAVFKSPITRTGIGAVASLSGIALHIICPPLVIPTAILGGVGPVTAVAGAVIDHRRRQREEAMRRAEEAARLERQAVEDGEREEAAAREREEDRERQHQLVEEIARLRELVYASGFRPVDNTALDEAEVFDVTIELTDRPTPADGATEDPKPTDPPDDEPTAETAHEIARRNQERLRSLAREYTLKRRPPNEPPPT